MKVSKEDRKYIIDFMNLLINRGKLDGYEWRMALMVIQKLEK